MRVAGFVFIGLLLISFSGQCLAGPKEIKQIQQALSDMGYEPGPVDGAWGGKTEAAARKFLSDKKLDTDSVFGRGDRNEASLLAHIKSVKEAKRRAAEEADIRAAKGLALIIGNSAYKSAKALKKPVKDAALMAATLEAVGFKVTYVKDANQKEMKKAMREFARSLRATDKPGFFYYAGHAIQVSGENYLIPVGAPIKSSLEVELEAVQLDAMLRTLERDASDISMVVLDTYNGNPYADIFELQQSGLATVQAPPGSYLAFASTSDLENGGTGKDYSPYSWALANAITNPGLPLEDVLKAARRNIVQVSRRSNIPFEASSITSEFAFTDKGSNIDLSRVLLRAQRNVGSNFYGKTILYQVCYHIKVRSEYHLRWIVQLIYFSTNGDRYFFHADDQGMKIESGKQSGKHVDQGILFKYNIREFPDRTVLKIDTKILKTPKFKWTDKLVFKPIDKDGCECDFHRKVDLSYVKTIRSWCNQCKVYEGASDTLIKKVFDGGKIRPGILKKCKG